MQDTFESEGGVISYARTTDKLGLSRGKWSCGHPNKSTLPADEQLGKRGEAGSKGGERDKRRRCEGKIMEIQLPETFYNPLQHFPSS